MEKERLLGKLRSLLSRAKEASENEGLLYVARRGVEKTEKYLVEILGHFHYRLFKSRRNFEFQGDSYRYLYHRYNTTWRNERSVEIPIILEMLNRSKAKNILEVGNVLSHYIRVHHDIIDKHEKAEGVVNQDVADFHPSKRYDLIISISTLEHVGWDEDANARMNLHDPAKILRAIRNLRELLTPQGSIVITLPLGYNPGLDRLLRNDEIQFSDRFCLRRISRDNKWIEVEWNEARALRYNSPFPAANGLVVGIFDK